MYGYGYIDIGFLTKVGNKAGEHPKTFFKDIETCFKYRRLSSTEPLVVLENNSKR